jgi:rhodanese-related sulfurtransferase
MKPLKKEELKKMIDNKEDFKLVNVLSEGAFEMKHIPGSISIPINDKFEDGVKKKISDKNAKIVVYCASFECQASPRAAKKLDEMGYTNVYDYEGGISDWEEAGYPLEGEKT